MSVAATSIRLDGVSKRFDHTVKGEVYAVREVSLAVEQGELLTLLGPSGCGKSTTLRMIAGFEEPDEGRIWIGDRDVTGLMANRRDIGFVFQNYALFPHLTVFDNVAYGLRIRGLESGELARRVGDVLGMVGLARYERQQPHQLSGGEQQRVALARAFSHRPVILFADEPTGNLDASTGATVIGLMTELNRELGTTLVLVTHDPDLAARARRIIRLADGAVVHDSAAA